MDIISYILSKKYTDNTVDGLGAIKGAPCTVKSIVDIDNGKRITLEWEGESGVKQTQSFDIYDGVDGKSITSAEINNNKHLIIHYSDGTSSDAGVIDIKSDVQSVNGKTGAVNLTASDVGALPSDTPLFSGDYDDLSNKPSIPTTTNDLVNNSNFVADANYVHTDNNYDATAKGIVDGVTDTLSNKVDKVNGKDLSTNDYTNSDKAIVDGVTAALAEKVDKVNGKGLSTEDYTAEEKAKLSGISSGAEANVQSDWNQSDNTSDDYIKNKPTFATVATSGDYEDLINTPNIPTATSDLNNDSGFITEVAMDDIEDVILNNLTNGQVLKYDNTIAKWVNANESGGGSSSLSELTDVNISNPSSNDVLMYNGTNWNNDQLASVALSGSYNDLSNTPTIPTKTSDLTNDSGFITSANVPTKVSDLINDTGFITSTVNNLTNYYKKNETYTQSEVDALISAIVTLNILVVQTLPTTDISTTTIYLVPKQTAGTQDVYDEYINTTGTTSGWEHIGTTEIDLSNYYTKSETDTLLSGKANVSDIPTVNDGTLTIKQNGVTKASFSANQSGNSTVDIETPVAEDITVVDEFTSLTGGKVKSAQMELKPIQDLHGYPNPWVGGAGKNKLDKDNYVLSYTSDNLVIIGTVNIESGKSYTFSCEQDKDLTGSTRNTLAVTYDGNTYYEMVNSNYHNEKGTHTYNFASNYTGTATLAFWCHTPSDTSVTYSKFMFQEGVYTAYEPYENKCPISGHTQAKLEQRGKNRFDNNAKTLGAYLTTEGATSGSGASDVTDYILIKSGNAVSFSFKYDSLSSSNTRIVCFYDKNKQFTEYTQYVPTDADKYKKVTFTPTNPDSVYIRITLDKGAKEIQVELGSTATDYEPYQGKDYIINLGGTYYWLRGDVVTGKWYVVGQSVDLGDYTFGVASDGWFQSTWGLSSLAKAVTNSEVANLTCDIFTKQSANVVYSRNINNTISVNDAKLIQGYTTAFAGKTGAEIKTALTGVTLIYELATPIPLDLTPQQILAIIGENHFSAPLEQQEIIEIIARNIAEFNEVIDDENVSEDFTYSSEKIEDRLDEYVDKDAIEEKSATTEFTTINGGILSSLKVSLTPNQDLHGYSEPWVGGAGKNKYNPDNTLNAYIGSVGGGYAVRANADTRTIYAPCLPNTTYTVSKTAGQRFSIGWTENLPADNVDVYNSASNNTASFMTITTGATAQYIVAFVWFGTYDTVTADEMLASCQIEVGNQPTTYEPYENICPISGHTQSKVQNHQKNLCDGTFTDYTIVWSDGSLISNQNHKTSQFISVDPNTDYVLSGTDLYTRYSGETTGAVIYAFYDKDQNFLYWSDVIYSGDVVMHTTADTRYIRFDCGGKATDVQLELGSTATAFKPYNGYQVTVNLGGTYYSGILDVVTGIFTPDTAKYVLTDISVLELYATDTSIGSYAKIKTTEYPSIKEDVSSELASSCKVVAFADRAVDVHDNRFFINQNYVLIRASIDENVTTVNELFAIFENCEFVLPLANPTPIQLSPTMVKALVGENHLSAPLDGQEITESKYRQLFTWDEVEELAQRIATSAVADLRCYQFDDGAYEILAYVDSGTVFYDWVAASPSVKMLSTISVMPPSSEIEFTNSSIFSSSICELVVVGDSDVPVVTHVKVTYGKVVFTLSEALSSTIQCACKVTNSILY